jgi:hypothetical protein
MSDKRNSAQLKGLQIRIKSLDGQAAELTDQINNLTRERDAKVRVSNGLKRQVDAIINDKGVQVTEHAILRYLERVKGVDLAQIEREILPDKTRDHIEELGAGNFPCGDHTLVVKDKMIITVNTKDREAA